MDALQRVAAAGHGRRRDVVADPAGAEGEPCVRASPCRSISPLFCRISQQDLATARRGLPTGLAPEAGRARRGSSPICLTSGSMPSASPRCMTRACSMSVSDHITPCESRMRATPPVSTISPARARGGQRLPTRRERAGQRAGGGEPRVPGWLRRRRAAAAVRRCCSGSSTTWAAVAPQPRRAAPGARRSRRAGRRSAVRRSARTDRSWRSARRCRSAS